jgi:hypothetical protein
MYTISDYWGRRLKGASHPQQSQLAGWSARPDGVEGFVEPELTVREGDPESAKILIVAAPGAVGKSSFARHLGQAVNYAMVDLALTSPLGGNFFKGGLANAFGLGALSAAAAGNIGLIVDALDEAQLRAGPQGYEAGLLDLATVAASSGGLPTVLFGRALAAEDAYLLLFDAGFSVCLFQIEFFDATRAGMYLQSKLPIVARRNESVLAAFNTHQQAFNKLAAETRMRLTSVQGGNEPRFAGYAPVLDAICEFTLESEELNPQTRLAKLGSDNQIELIRDITSSILDREQKKLVAQFSEQHPNLPENVASALYTPAEQLGRVSSVLFGSSPPKPPVLSDATLQTAYLEMVAQFAPQHPFLSGSSGPANLVFAGYVVVWALTQGADADVARKAIRAKPSLVSGVLFELYVNWLLGDKARSLPLADVGILYQSLSSQIATGQRVSLEIAEEADENTLEVQFEILERADQAGNVKQGLVWGPFPSAHGTILELRSPFSNVFIDASIWVQLGDDITQQVGAPTEITTSQLSISAKQLLIHQASGNTQPERQTVLLIAQEADCDSVQNVLVKDSAVLAVSWPGAKIHPWVSFVTEVPTAPPDIDFMRRRLKKILTAFRSHSKGSLVRLAAKIDHSRMTKDARGRALVSRLISDKILTAFDAGKFYVLDPDRMGLLLGVTYQGLNLQRFTEKSDAYLADVLRTVDN